MRKLILILLFAFSLQASAQRWSGNPILAGLHADPEIVYSQLTHRYYIYTTSDGFPHWGGWYLTAFSSSDLTSWKYEGIVLNLPRDTRWASGNAWAPAIIERQEGDRFRYYLYYSGETGHGKAIGVAVADSPVGPFVDSGKPIVDQRPAGVKGGQQIDVDVFQDPRSGRYYLYWGNGYMAGAELNDDLCSIKPESVTVLTPKGGTLSDYAFREGTYVFYRKGIYYFLWSVDDTGSPNYHVAYGTSDNPLGPIQVAANPIVLIQDPSQEIYGPAHNSVLQVPGTDDWYIVYHRINKHFLDKAKGPGMHRETCIDRMYFNSDGSIRRVVPTQRGVKALE
jgi:beta-xylosidase